MVSLSLGLMTSTSRIRGRTNARSLRTTRDTDAGSAAFPTKRAPVEGENRLRPTIYKINQTQARTDDDDELFVRGETREKFVTHLGRSVCPAHATSEAGA